MDMIAQLWLPILVSAVAIFIVSFLVWMVLPHHKADIKKLPDEPAFVETLGRMNLPPGVYMWPNCETKEEFNSDEFKQRYEAGPWGNITVVGAKPNMGANLAIVFVFYLIVSLLTAYITGEAREPGASFSQVFQIAATVAAMAYALGSVPHDIWFGKPMRFRVTEFIDQIVYGLITGAIFAVMWPGG